MLIRSERNALQRVVEDAGIDFSAFLEAVSKDTARKISAGMSVSNALDVAISGSGISSDVFDEATKNIVSTAISATEIGLGSSYFVVNVPERSMQILNTVYEGKKLSARLHAFANETEKTVRDSVRVAINQNTSVKSVSKALQSSVKIKDSTAKGIMSIAETAEKKISGGLSAKEHKKFITSIATERKRVEKLSQDPNTPTKYLKNAYKRLLDAAAKGDEETLRLAIDAATKAKTRYHYDMISRSEVARAYDEGFMRQIEDDHDIIGYRSILSPAHPRADICDVYAGADMFGMGDGVFPKGYVIPIPYHPHCLCMKEPVYSDGSEHPKAMIPGSVTKYLDNLSASERTQIMGSKGAADTGHWRKYLATRNWEEPARPQRRELAGVAEKK